MGITLSINDIKRITREMAQYDNMDYTGCLFSFLKRRLGYVFNEMRVRKLTQFSERLHDKSFRENVKYHMAVNITEMFRDPGFWRSLRHNVFPLFQDGKLSVWFPDTSSGEEVFSLVILLIEDGLNQNVRILCQHPSEEKCREIAHGTLHANDLELNHNNYKRLEEGDRFIDYFKEENGILRFRDELLGVCEIKTSMVGDDNENGSFDLIIFRNSAINYTYQKREEILKKLIDCLNPGGFIAIGIRESVPESLYDYLIPIDERECIFRKPGFNNNNGPHNGDSR
jgi:chemotaxis protein methyltransferase CheR